MAMDSTLLELRCLRTYVDDAPLVEWMYWKDEAYVSNYCDKYYEACKRKYVRKLESNVCLFCELINDEFVDFYDETCCQECMDLLRTDFDFKLTKIREELTTQVNNSQYVGCVVCYEWMPTKCYYDICKTCKSVVCKSCLISLIKVAYEKEEFLRCPSCRGSKWIQYGIDPENVPVEKRYSCFSREVVFEHVFFQYYSTFMDRVNHIRPCTDNDITAKDTVYLSTYCNAPGNECNMDCLQWAKIKEIDNVNRRLQTFSRQIATLMPPSPPVASPRRRGYRGGRRPSFIGRRDSHRLTIRDIRRMTENL